MTKHEKARIKGITADQKRRTREGKAAFALALAQKQAREARLEELRQEEQNAWMTEQELRRKAKDVPVSANLGYVW